VADPRGNVLIAERESALAGAGAHLNGSKASSRGPELRRLLIEIKDRDPRVRDRAARALGELGDPRGATSLASALRDDFHEVRWSAAAALTELRDPRAHAFYAAAIRGTSRADRWAAVWALGKALGHGDRRVLPALRGALAHPDPEVRSAAHTLVGTEPF
jgi:HEAT repeat protein